MNGTGLSERICTLRKTMGLSQSRFAARFHIPVATLRDWEQGRRRPPEYVVYMMEEIAFSETSDYDD